MLRMLQILGAEVHPYLLQILKLKPLTVLFNLELKGLYFVFSWTPLASGLLLARIMQATMAFHLPAIMAGCN